MQVKMFDIITLLLFAVSLLVWKFLNHYTANKIFKGVPAVPGSIPIVGHVPYSGTYPHQTFAKWSHQYGNMFRVKFGTKTMIVVNGWDSIKLIGERKSCSGRPHAFMGSILKEYFSFDSSPEALPMRKKCVRGLNFVESFNVAEIVDKKCEDYVKTLIMNGKKPSSNVTDDVCRIVTETNWRFCFGGEETQEVKNLLNRMIDYRDDFLKAAGSLNIIETFPWLLKVHPKLKREYKEFQNYLQLNYDFTREFIETRLAQTAPTSSKKVDNILDGLRAVSHDGKAPEDDAQLFLQAGGILGAALDTTTTTIVWCLLFLCKYPENQTKLWNELCDNVDQNETVTEHERGTLVKLESFISEVMRYITPFPMALPHCTTEDVIIKDLTIPKNTSLLLNLWSANHEPQTWLNPNQFQPSRFVKEGVIDKEKMGKMLNFGSGYRRCIGETLARDEVFVFLANFIRRCEIRLAEDSKDVDVDCGVPGLNLCAPPFRIMATLRN